jgi:hypothetical protein
MPMLLLDRPAKASATGVPPPHAQKCIFSSAGASTRLWGAPAACARGGIGGRASVGQAIRLTRQGVSFRRNPLPRRGGKKRSSWGEPVSNRTTTFVEPPLLHPRPARRHRHRGGRQELRPRSPTGGPVSLGSMSVEAVSRA